jgi:hypothetical protein
MQLTDKEAIEKLLESASSENLNSYCSACKKHRYFKTGFLPTSAVHWTPKELAQNLNLTPFAVWLQCDHCSIIFWSFGYQQKESGKVASFSNRTYSNGSLHAPEEVNRFLDEANKCKAVGAIVAAIAMYRSALEHILIFEGFTTGLLSEKIADLEAALTLNNGPKWSNKVTTEIMSTIKNLGNTSIHAKTVDQLKEMNTMDLNKYQIVFDYLLFVIYEADEPMKKLKRKLDHLIKELPADAQ